MFELAQFRAWVEAQPGEIVGMSRGSVWRILTFRDDSPVGVWVSGLVGRRVSLMGGSVRAVPSQVMQRGIKLPRWCYEVDRWCNRRRTTPITKTALLEELTRRALPAPPAPPAPARRRP